MTVHSPNEKYLEIVFVPYGEKVNREFSFEAHDVSIFTHIHFGVKKSIERSKISTDSFNKINNSLAYKYQNQTIYHFSNFKTIFNANVEITDTKINNTIQKLLRIRRLSFFCR